MRPVPPATLARLLRARDRMHDAPDDAPSLVELAEGARMSRAHFLRSFAQAFGTTPHEYVIEVRLDRARRALARGASVTEASVDVGYASLATFSRLFTGRFGVSPRAWQRRVRTVLPSAELWPAIWIPGCFLSAHAPSTFGQAPLGTAP